MKKPNAEQLAQLKQLRQYPKVIEYLSAVVADNQFQLAMEPDINRVRQLQGSTCDLLQLITAITKE